MEGKMFRAAVGVVAVAVSLVLSATAFPQQPDHPVIGMFTEPLTDCPTVPKGVNASYCVGSVYAEWMQSAGIRVVPFPYDIQGQARMDLIQSVNGIFFQGGMLSGQDRVKFFQYVQEVFDIAVNLNANGDPFVLWGTCQGFQLLNAAAARNISVIERGFTGLFPRMLSINFTAQQPTSRIFGNSTTPSQILTILATENSTVNWHHDGVTPNGYKYNRLMRKFFKIVSTNIDPYDGRPFISTVEAYNAAIYATQYHPERPPYDFSNDLLGHSDDDIAVSNYLAKFLRDQLRKNNHSFPTPQDAENINVLNYPSSYEGWGPSVYWIDSI